MAGRAVVGLAPAGSGSTGRVVVGLAPSGKGPTGRAVVGLAGAQPAAKKSGGGLLHSIAKYSGAELVGNLGKDIGSTLIGVGPGIVHVGKDVALDIRDIPKNAGQGISRGFAGAGGGTAQGQAAAPLSRTSDNIIAAAKGYKDYYGHDLAHHIYTHPLQPLLDAATIADLGATAGVRTGVLSGERASLVTRSPRAIATGKGDVHVDLTSTKPLVRAREQAGPKITGKEGLGKGPLRVGGEVKRYGKQIQAQATQHAMGNMAPHDVYYKSTKGLSHDEWSALHIRAMDIHPSDLKVLWKNTPLEKVANDTKIEKLALSPSKRMLKAEPAAQMLSKQGAQLLKEKGMLKDETAAARPELTKVQASKQLGRPVKTITGEPYYFPHTMEPARNVNPLQSAGGGKGVPKAPGSTKQNLGVLALRGKLHLRSDVLGPEFLRRVKYVKYDEIHNALVRGSVKMTQQQLDAIGGHPPKGWDYMRTKPAKVEQRVSAEPNPNQLRFPGTGSATTTKQVTVGGRTIPATMRGEGTTSIPIEKLVPNPSDLHDSPLAEGFTTNDPGQAHVVNGQYHIIPKATAKAATGEFTRSSDFTRNFIKRPLSVWRAAVLGLRVGFLTNNLVGNSVMYAVHTGGQGALRDLFGAILESHGRETALKILDDPATPPKFRTDMYKEHFPEQIGGTFGKTQSPATSPAHVAGRKATEVARGVTGSIPRLTSKVAEETPRRALIRNTIRRSPEFKKVYEAMPKETRTFETAARKVLAGEGGPEYQRYVSKQVDHALGNYTNMSPFERNVMRNALPFYSWYRAIVQTTFHLAADTPLRANLLAQIGRIGQQYGVKDVPSFLEGAVGLGPGRNGTVKALSTQSLNPYATLPQLAKGVTSDVGSLGINPFLLGGAEAYSKLTAHGKKASGGRIAYDTLKAMAQGLPPARLAKPLPPSALYPNRNRHSELLSWLGVPIKEYDPNVAAQQKAQGR